MPFTHYPKLADNIIFAWVQPPPPRQKPFLNMRPFADLNLFDEPIEPGKAVVAYQDAQNFTRFYGSIACDQPLEVTFAFSNDEVDIDGGYVTDDNIEKLHYDAEGLKQLYDPGKQGPTGKYFVTIYGRWLRVEIKNTGKQVPTFMRVYTRGSVF
jgi:hypothetical protein